MAVVVHPHLSPVPAEQGVPALEPGDHLDQPTFHARYHAMPPGIKAELVGGIVYMPSPAKRVHASHTGKVMVWLSLYEEATPGVEVLDNVTVILGPDSEPQPDASLILQPEAGGQVREQDGWIVGPPELVVEVASSSESYDLHSKKRDYERAGIREYVVVLLRPGRIAWYVLRNRVFEELAPGEDGVFRSEVFPGLWLDPAALLRRDIGGIRDVIEQGVTTEEHRAFVDRLAAALAASE